LEANEALKSPVYDDASHRGTMSLEGRFLMHFVVIIKENLYELIPKIGLNDLESIKVTNVVIV